MDTGMRLMNESITRYPCINQAIVLTPGTLEANPVDFI